MGLTAAQREAYERDGFIVVEGVLSPVEMDDLRRVTDELVEKRAPPDRARRGLRSRAVAHAGGAAGAAHQDAASAASGLRLR